MRSAILLAILFFVPTANAGETAWQELAPGVSIRVITADAREPDGSVLAALQLDMPADYKTYWMIPGETGLPTQIDLAGSVGVSDAEIVWPLPEAQVTSGYVDYVFHGPTVLPIRLAVGDGAAALQLKARLGVCSEVCVPAVADFDLPLSLVHPDMAHGLRIRQALADVPIDWEEGRPSPVASATWDSTAQALRLELAADDLDPNSLLGWTGTQSLFGPPKQQADGSLLLPLLVGDPPAAQASVNLAFATSRGPYRIAVALKP